MNYQNNQYTYDRNPNRQQTYQHPNTYNARVNRPQQYEQQQNATWASQFSNDQYKQYQSYQRDRINHSNPKHSIDHI